MKSKDGLDIIIRDFSLNPKCKHGPTILFSHKNKKFFACGTDRRNCLYLKYDQFERNKQKILSEPIERLDEKIDFSYANEKSIQEPSLILPQLDNDEINAQYFFSDTTLIFLSSIFNQLDLTKVICIGAPRVHDYLRTNQEGKFKSILLDIDSRFQRFYPEEFCHYNMFNHYFFNGQHDEEKLKKFLIDDEDEKSHHCIVIDPPFAARSEVLSNVIRIISSLFYQLNRKLLPVFWIFPYFNEMHIKKVMPEMEMLDFQVTYMNHNHFSDSYKGRKAGSPIRIFTNIDQRLIPYPSIVLDNYKFCVPCKRFVALTNQHCYICKICPAKNGSTYLHCNQCIKCVKPNYTHCSNCDRCCQPSSHDCKTFQLYQVCWLCDKIGHVEKYCDQMRRFKRAKKNGTCIVCKGNEKHNLSICPSKGNFIKLQ